MLSKTFPSVTQHLKLFISREHPSIDLTFKQKGNYIYCIYSDAIYYQAILAETANVNDYNLVVSYTDISTLMTANDPINLELYDNYVLLTNNTLEIVLPQSFNSIAEVMHFDLSKYNYTEVQDKQLCYKQLKSFLHTNTLFSLYHKEWSYDVKNSVILLKTPSIWVQGRCTGLGLTLTADISLLRLLCQLQPQTFYTDSETLVMTDSVYTCAVPINSTPTDDDNTLTSQLESMQSTDPISTKTLTSLIAACAYSKQTVCDITVYKNSIQLTLDNLTSLKIHTKVDATLTETLGSCKVPTDLLVVLFKLVCVDTWFQALITKGRLCLRTPNLIILICV